MRHGVILEVQEETWLILSADGEFLTVPREDRSKQIGDEIVLPEAVIPKPGPTYRIRWISSIAAVLVFCLLSLWFWPSSSTHASTVIYLDGAGSVELELNENLQIVSLRPLNATGESFTQTLTWKGQNVEQFLDKWFQVTKQKNPNLRKRLVLSAFENSSGQKVLPQVRKIIQKIQKKQKEPLEITTITVPPDIKKDVEKSGLSPGRYAVWFFARQKDEKISLQYVSQTPVEELQQNQFVHKNLENPPTKKDWEGVLQKETPKEEEKQPQQSEKPKQEPTPSTETLEQKEKEKEKETMEQKPKQSETDNSTSEKQPENSTPEENQTSPPDGSSEPTP